MKNSIAMEPDDLIYPEWQNPLQEALLELDEEKLQARMAGARDAISNRLQVISQNTNHQAEREAIRDALAILRMLENENRKAS
jgi:hypothetical protein